MKQIELHHFMTPEDLSILMGHYKMCFVTYILVAEYLCSFYLTYHILSASLSIL